MGGKPLVRNNIANLAEVHKRLEKGHLNKKSQMVAQYLLQHETISIEQICASTHQEKEEVDKVMEKYHWYSGLPSISRIQAIDDLVEQGIPSLQKMSEQIGKYRQTIKHYLVTRRLYEYWEMKVKQHGNNITKLGESDKYPSLRDPLVRKLPSYDSAAIYKVGQTLFFNGFGKGQVVEVNSRRITVTLDGGEKREFVHGVAHNPHYRSKL